MDGWSIYLIESQMIWRCYGTAWNFLGREKGGLPLRQRPPRHDVQQHCGPAAFGHLEITVELEQLGLRVQVGGWDHVREINRHLNIACPV